MDCHCWSYTTKISSNWIYFFIFRRWNCFIWILTWLYVFFVFFFFCSEMIINDIYIYILNRCRWNSSWWKYSQSAVSSLSLAFCCWTVIERRIGRLVRSHYHLFRHLHHLRLDCRIPTCQEIRSCWSSARQR